MKDQAKTKQVLIQELAASRQRIKELEQSESDWKNERDGLKKSEARFRSYFELPVYGIAITSPEKGWIEVNDRICSIMGYSRNEIIRMTWSEMTYPDDLVADLEQFKRILSGQIDQYHMEKRFIRKDGRVIWTNLSAGCVRKSDGSVDHMVIMIEDITSVKLAEEAIAESEEKFRKAFYMSPDSVNINRLEDGTYVSINPGFTRITGYTEEEIIGKTSIECNIWHTIEDRQRLVAGLRKDGEVTNLDAVFRMKNGDLRYGLMSASVIDLKGVPHILSITRDITDRKRAEEALKESENKYRLLADNVNDVIFILDMNLHYTYVSPSVKILRGYEPEEVLKEPSFKTLMPSSWELAVKALSESIELEKSGEINIPLSRTLQLEMIRKDGTTVWTEVKFSFIRDEDRQLVGILGVTRDITERKRVEEYLSQSEKKFRTLTENTPDIVSRVDRELRHVFINKAIEKVTNLKAEDYLGKTNEDLGMPEENLALWNHHFRKVFETAAPVNFEFDFPSPDGIRSYFSTLVPEFDEKGGVSTVLALARDITDRKESMEKLRKALGATVQAIAVTVETRDPFTAGHQRGVADLAHAIAMEMNLSSDRIDGIRMAAIVHDLGKISVPAEILSKPTRLTKLEFELIKTHARSGYDILKDIEFPWPIARMVLEHHERMNGSGYPNGLRNDHLLLESRILAVADVVEAMASHRPYRPGLGIEAALEEIEKNKGILYDHAVADTCLRLFREGGYQLRGD